MSAGSWADGLLDVALTPSRAWSEAAQQQEQHGVSKSSPPPPPPPSSKPSLLGISLRACNPAHALESVYHVLDVLEGSPAEVGKFLLFAADESAPG